MADSFAKQLRERLFMITVLLAVACGYIAMLFVADWLSHLFPEIDDENGRCGLQHHWQYHQSGSELEKSCEPD